MAFDLEHLEKENWLQHTSAMKGPRHLQYHFTSLNVFCLLSFQLQERCIPVFMSLHDKHNRGFDPVNMKAALMTVCSQ